jgi:hypothetical protein
MTTNFIFGLRIQLNELLFLISGNLGYVDVESILNHIPHFFINCSEADLHLLLLEGIIRPIEDGDLEM